MRLCSYIIKEDTGLAPNPFWGWCTIAVCTPNHMNIKLVSGDWIIGTGVNGMAGKLVYAMKVSEKIHFDSYFKDIRFQNKKPQLDSDWKKQCGDNMYFFDENGRWKQKTVLHHDTAKDRKTDTRYPYVYVANQFYYFGEHAIDIPSQFQVLIKQGRGCLCTHPEALVAQFLVWLEEKYTPGIHGPPKDRNTSKRCTRIRDSC